MKEGNAANHLVFRFGFQKTAGVHRCQYQSSLMQDRARVVLDMAGVKFVDSSGLGALISCLRQANGRKGDLRLCEMSRTVRALFELMRMHRVFNIHDTRADAVASFN